MSFRLGAQPQHTQHWAHRGWKNLLSGAVVVCCMKCRMFWQLLKLLITRLSVHCVSAVLQPWRKCAVAGLTAKLLKYRSGGQSGDRNSGPSLIADGLDVVIRVWALQTSTCSRRLGAMPMVVCAAKPRSVRRPRKTRRSRSSHSRLEYSDAPG